MKKLLSLAAGFAALIAFDQLAKYWASTFLRSSGPIRLIPGVLELVYVENRGAAFGLLQNFRGIFVIMTVLILAVLLWMNLRMPSGGRYLPMRVCMYILGAGAVGNLIDRVLKAYVTDFIYFRLIDFPVFNIADIYVTCSAFAIVFLLLFYYKDGELDMVLPGSRKQEDPEE